MYTYFRYNCKGSVMVILNKNTEEKTLNTTRFAESMNGVTSGTDIVSGMKINDLSGIKVPARSAMIIELK